MTILASIAELDGNATPAAIDLDRCFNLGFTIRDPEKMQQHLDEVYRLGLKEINCARPPLVMPISAWAVTSSSTLDLQRGRTSGEVEIVTVTSGEHGTLVGVGSDHTDRALETIDIPWAKQVAPNVVAPTLWRWADVEPHWDAVTMDSWVVDDGERVHFQHAGVEEFWTPPEMLAAVRGRVTERPGAMALFSGTVVSLEGRIRFGRTWTIQMSDPVLNRTIEHTYQVVVLAEEILDDGSLSGDLARGSAAVEQ